MGRVITCSFGERSIGVIADCLMENYRARGGDLSRVAVIFGGRRPALFLKRELAARIGRSFHPPQCFSMDDFVARLVSRRGHYRPMGDMDACYLVYRLAREAAAGITAGRESFARFLPWAREIVSFIEQCDLEAIESAALMNIQLGASIGYEVPESVNRLLMQISSLREAYHRAIEESGAYPRGFTYLTASRAVRETDPDGFDELVFCNFFYLHRTEEELIGYLHGAGRATLIFQSDGGRWQSLERLSRVLRCRIAPREQPELSYALHLLAGFDTHSQVGLVRELVKGLAQRERAVIVLPDPGSLVPLISEIAPHADQFNISMGYPIARSSLCGLFRCVMDAQRSRRDGSYYARDYLNVLTHPLLKNLSLVLDPAVTRILVHRVEEVLSGAIPTALGGSLFVVPEEIMRCGEVYRLTAGTLKGMGIPLDPAELPAVFATLHEIGFGIWEGLRSLSDFSAAMGRFLSVLMEKSSLPLYLMNVKITERILEIADELARASFGGEPFGREEIFRIFQDALDHEKISFSGSPLGGLQVLGLFETRALDFEHVIIMDVNEAVLPSLRMSEPLIPRQVLMSLGLNRVEQEEEIQRYHFKRLVAHAKHVYCVYDDNPEKERSRFVEEMLWERQKRMKSLRVLPVRRGGFATDIAPKSTGVKKTAEVLDSLRAMTYSPTSLDTYCACPLSFYYRYVLRLMEKEDLLEEPEGADLGAFIHELLFETFAPFIGHPPRIDRAFRDNFFSCLEKRFDERLGRRMGAEAFLARYVIRFKLGRFLDREAGRDVAAILSLEEECRGEIELSGGAYRFFCRVDRVDRLGDGSVLIMDYKTGGGDVRPRAKTILSGVEHSRGAIRNVIRSFQLPLYWHFLRGRYPGAQIGTALYNLRTLTMHEFPPRRDRDHTEEIVGECVKALDAVLAEIANPNVPFTADEEDKRRCAACPFFSLCR